MTCPSHCVKTPDGVCRQPIAGMPWRKWPECRDLPDVPVPPLPIISLGQLPWWLLLGAAILADRWWNNER